jgi:hypothetical protein
MTGDRHTLRLANEAIRAKAAKWIQAAPIGWTIEFAAPRRTSEQSDRMWAMLSDIARQRDHFGKKYPKEAWKLIFLSALGHEVQFAPALNGNGLVPLGASSRKLTKSEMSDMIELLFQQGAEWGIRWSDPTLIQGDERRAA